MAGPQAQIADALLAYLGGLTFSPTVLVLQSNLAGKPPNKQPHLAANVLWIPPSTNALSFLGSVRHACILQVDVVWPEGAGPIKPLELVSQITGAFKCGTEVAATGFLLRVYEPPEPAPNGFQDPPWWRHPVSIRFQTFLPNT